MNVSDLSKYLRDRSNLTLKDADSTVRTIIDGIRYGLYADGEVRLTDLGTFKVETRPARKGRNPQTGAEIDIPEKNVVKFKAVSTIFD